uniref:Reverse transcriptase domain-containing protein n=1 Tax=Erpetoichthys calabaricus TaxID=27687 RepID=A0A8C4T619_ERPCA
LSSGVVPNLFKLAIVQPLIKKPSLDPTVLSNFRPISKLPFLSKILERSVYIQLKAFLDKSDFLKVFQSGFKPLHSTETALLKVFNDILLATDSGDYVILVLLDLTAAFDTIHHSILLSHLEHCVGIRGTALAWFKSYLTQRTFSVRLDEFRSSSASLSCGVPQGSILGPLLFSLYLLPLGSILRKHKIALHCYVDDTQVYVPLKRKDAYSIQTLVMCLEEVKAWMAVNFLNFNENKTEVIVFGPGGTSGSISTSAPVDLGPLAQYGTPVITNLGFRIDEDFRLDGQISTVVKSCFFSAETFGKDKKHSFQRSIYNNNPRFHYNPAGLL